MLDVPIAWLDEHRTLLTMLGTLSVLLLTVTVLATPWLLGRLPSDHFSKPRAPLAERGVRRLLLLVVRNLAGATFILLGLVMLVTPGPGLVGLLLGLSLCEFPGKHALLGRLAARPDVFASLNWIRSRGGHPPFDRPPSRPTV